MKVTNGRKGDAPKKRVYCASAATRPLEAARLWQECGDAREFACRVLGGVMNALMDSEAQQMCGASRNERSDGRENSRNGYRPRSLKTAVGDVELEIPKLRHGTYYPEGMLARWSRVDTSVASIVQEMYVCGVSTRKVERVASSWAYPRCRARRSRASAPTSTPRWMSSAAATFGHAVLLPVARRHLHELQGRLVGRLAGRRDRDRAGRRRAQSTSLGCDVVDTESEDSRAAFLGGLRERGLAGVRSWSPTATPGSWPPSRACSGLRGSAA